MLFFMKQTLHLIWQHIKEIRHLCKLITKYVELHKYQSHHGTEVYSLYQACPFSFYEIFLPIWGLYINGIMQCAFLCVSPFSVRWYCNPSIFTHLFIVCEISTLLYEYDIFKTILSNLVPFSYMGFMNNCVMKSLSYIFLHISYL